MGTGSTGPGGWNHEEAARTPAGCLIVTLAVGITVCSSSTPTTTTSVPGVHADPLTRIRASVATTEAAGSAHFVTATTTQPVAGSIPSTVQHTVGTGDVEVLVGPDIELATGAQLPDVPHPPVTRVLRIGYSGERVHRTDGHPVVRSYTLAKNVNYLVHSTAAQLVDADGPVKRARGTTTMDGSTGHRVRGGHAGRDLDSVRIGQRNPEHITVAPFVAHVWLDGARPDRADIGNSRRHRRSASSITGIGPGAVHLLLHLDGHVVEVR